jgi:hypothetical protein
MVKEDKLKFRPNALVFFDIFIVAFKVEFILNAGETVSFVSYCRFNTPFIICKKRNSWDKFYSELLMLSKPSKEYQFIKHKKAKSR